jgi:hypothetical protein
VSLTPSQQGADPESRVFPFVRPSADVRGLVTHCQLALRWLGGGAPSYPFRVSALYGLGAALGTPGALAGPAHPVDITIVADGGNVVFDSSTNPALAYRRIDFGDTAIHSWQDTRSLCRLVQCAATYYTSRGETLPAPADELRPLDGTLDPRCVDLLAPDVEAIGLDGIDPTAGALYLIVGYNTEIKVTSWVSPLGPGHVITLSAPPGAGAGRTPACEAPAEELVRVLGGSRGDVRGDFVIASRDGFDLKPEVWIEGEEAGVYPHALRLDTAVAPCYRCADFERMQRDLLGVWGQHEDAAGTYLAAKQQYAELQARWDAERARRDLAPVSLQMTGHHERFVDVQLTMCNKGTRPLRDIELDYELGFTGYFDDGVSSLGGELPDYAPEITDVFIHPPGCDWRAYEPVALDPLPFGVGLLGYRAVLDELAPQQQLHLRFRVAVGADTGPVIVTALARSSIRDPFGALYPPIVRSEAPR